MVNYDYKSENSSSQHSSTIDKSFMRRRGSAIEFYLELGLPLFALRKKGKNPATSHGFKDATLDKKILDKQFQRHPEGNLGGRTGGNIFVLDLDQRLGLPSVEYTLHDIEEEFGKLPDTPYVMTGGGGLHFFFSNPDNLVLPGKPGFRPGVDFKGDGGYVVLPPSIHPSGKSYEWDASFHIRDVPLAPIPRWLAQLAQKDRESAPATSNTEWKQLLQSGVGNGCRNVSLTKIAGHLFRRSVDDSLIAEILASLNKTIVSPPLCRSEVMSIFKSIQRKEIQRKLIGRNK